jgi:hypothetical protein
MGTVVILSITATGHPCHIYIEREGDLERERNDCGYIIRQNIYIYIYEILCFLWWGRPERAPPSTRLGAAHFQVEPPHGLLGTERPMCRERSWHHRKTAAGLVGNLLWELETCLCAPPRGSRSQSLTGHMVTWFTGWLVGWLAAWLLDV